MLILLTDFGKVRVVYSILVVRLLVATQALYGPRVRVWPRGLSPFPLT